MPARIAPAERDQDIVRPEPAMHEALGNETMRALAVLADQRIGGAFAQVPTLKERKIEVRCVLTKAAQQFVTPLSASALAHERVYTDLFDPQSEFDAGHIRLARDCDLIVVAPATADLMAKMAQGNADDLALFGK